MGRSDAPFSTGTVLKLVIAAAIVAITAGLILLFSDALSRYHPSPYLLLAIAGAVVLVMAYLSIRIFERL